MALEHLQGRDALLEPAPAALQLASNYTGRELADILLAHGLPSGGRKDDRVKRLVAAGKGLESPLPLERQVWQLTPPGRELAERYLQDRQGLLQVLQSQWKGEPAAADRVRKPPRKAMISLLTWLMKEGLLSEEVVREVHAVLKEVVPDVVARLSRLPAGARVTPTWMNLELQIEWCTVPAGPFTMGSSEQEKDTRRNEQPQHQLYLPTFRISTYPITNEQYALFVAETDYRTPFYWKRDLIPEGKEKHPIVHIDFHDALAFCEWATRKSGFEITLPSEAEWEKAARGTDGRIYPWGNSWRKGMCRTEEEGADITAGNPHAGSTQTFTILEDETTAVDAYPGSVSPYGLYDTVGNVWEWTRSLWGEKWDFPEYGYPYRPDDGREEVAAPDDSMRVLRGGSWINHRRYARTAFRLRRHPRYLSYDIGFRVSSPAFEEGSGC